MAAPFLVKAQDSTMLATRKVRLAAARVSDWDFDTVYSRPLDTGQTGVQRFNPLQKNHSDHLFLGVAGSPARSFSPVEVPFELLPIGWRQQLPFSTRPENQLFYQTNTPYTRLHFLTGGMVEQNFEVVHTQNLGSRFNVAARYHQIGSDGIYARQEGYSRNLDLSLQLQAFKMRYKLMAGFITNTQRMMDNGGISNPELFERASSTPRLVENVRLRNTASRYREALLHWNQLYRIGGDSLSGGFVLEQAGQYGQFYRTFTDDFLPQAGFYRGLYLDSAKTADSTAVTEFRNQFSIRNFKSSAWFWKVGITSAYYTILAPLWTQQIHKTSLDAATQLSMSRDFSIAGHLNWIIQDPTGAGGFNGLGTVKWNRVIPVEAGLSLRKQSIDLLLQRFSGNYYQWGDGSLGENFTESKLFVKAGNQNLSLGVSLHQLNGWAYLSANDSTPRIAGKDGASADIRLVTAWMQYQLRWKWFNWSGRIQANYTGDQRMNLPAFQTSQSLFVAFGFRKTDLRLQFGADLFFQSQWNGDAWMPSTGLWMNQNSFLTGGYPRIDPFATMKLKRTRLFVKFENAFQGFPADGYFTVPLYPMMDRVWRLGFSWDFYD